MMTDAALLVYNGYTFFGKDALREHAEAFYQKWIRDGDGNKKYAINVYRYRLPMLPQPRYEYEVQFNSDLTFNVSTVDEVTVEQAETFFETLWQAMGCHKYE